MFNKIIIAQRSTEYVPYEKTVTTHEHRAPTDESVKLLREMEEKAWDQVTSAIMKDLPSIEAKYVEVARDPCGQERHFLFKINGVPIKFSVSEHGHGLNPHGFVESMAKEIVRQLFRKLAEGLKQ